MHFVISQNKKELYAVVCETLRYLDILNQIIKNTKLIKREKKIIKNRYLALVLLYEYVVGKGFHKLPKHLKVWFNIHSLMFSYIFHQPNEDQEHLFYGYILDNFLDVFFSVAGNTGT